MKQPIVEGGCTQRPFGFGGMFPRRKPTKQDAKRLVTQVDRAMHAMGWPWRALRPVLRRVRPGA
jgi:hypothetical protein